MAVPDQRVTGSGCSGGWEMQISAGGEHVQAGLLCHFES